MSQEKKQSISVDEQKLKRRELVIKIRTVIEIIKQTNIEEQVKEDLLIQMNQILERAVLTEEVVRLADVVYKVTKSEETDIKYKGFLKSSLYKIYSSTNIT